MRDGALLSLAAVGLLAAAGVASRRGSRAKRLVVDPGTGEPAVYRFKVDVERTITGTQRATLRVEAPTAPRARSIAKELMLWEGNDARHPKIDWKPESINVQDQKSRVTWVSGPGDRVWPGVPRLTGREDE
jgi:hypothetical protein